MIEEHTSAVVQRYLDEWPSLAGDSPTEPVVQALLGRSVRRLHRLCGSLLCRSYPRLTRPPLNLQADELLGAVVERLLKALREACLLPTIRKAKRTKGLRAPCVELQLEGPRAEPPCFPGIFAIPSFAP